VTVLSCDSDDTANSKSSGDSKSSSSKGAKTVPDAARVAEGGSRTRANITAPAKPSSLTGSIKVAATKAVVVATPSWLEDILNEPTPNPTDWLSPMLLIARRFPVSVMVCHREVIKLLSEVGLLLNAFDSIKMV
jgi:hypothetical protein